MSDDVRRSVKDLAAQLAMHACFNPEARATRAMTAPTPLRPRIFQMFAPIAVEHKEPEVVKAPV